MELEKLKKYLFEKAMKGRWEEVVDMYESDVRARDLKITKRGDTVLHVAVSDSQVRAVERLIKSNYSSANAKANAKKVLAMANDRSITALHMAATLGNVKMCDDIASVEPSLIGIRNDKGETPLFLAALHGNREAFLRLHLICNCTPEYCRRSYDGQNILHCAILGDFFELALHIIKLYKELVNSVNVKGLTPLHLLAAKPSAFKSGTHLRRWKTIVYHCIVVDEIRVEANSSFGGVPKNRESIVHQSGSSYENDDKCYPPNYSTCFHLLHYLWKGIRIVCTLGKTNQKPNNHKPNNIADENPPQQKGIVVDEIRAEANSFFGGVPKNRESIVHQLGSSYENDDKCYPPNYSTCFHLFHYLWKGIRIVCTLGKTNQKPNNHKPNNIADAENPPQQKAHDSMDKHQGFAIFPQNYATCFYFLKFISKALLIILGLGFSHIKKIQQRKEKHIWAVQVMNQLLECASMYEYDDNGSTPPIESKQEEQETHPYHFADGNVTFHDYNISQLPAQNLQPPQLPNMPPDDTVNDEEKKEQGTKGETDIVIESMSSLGDKILKHFPISIRHKSSNKKMVLTVATETEETTDGKSRLRQDTPVLIAAKYGVVEMVEKILHLFPVAIHDLTADQKNIVLLAVENRHPHVYKLLIDRNVLKESAFRIVDSQGNSALHLAAKLSDHKPWLIPGAALQMQWELKWYQFVKESMPPNFFPQYNKEGKTARVILFETHSDLVTSGGKWLTNTSESCSLVAALIATVAFATAATVPGGNDQNKGTPLLHGQPVFNVFVIASLIALSSSVTSLVMFLSILTSRFQEKDFGRDLPIKLLLGLSSLFVSIAAMLVSFCAGHYFVLNEKHKYASLSVYAITCLPVTLFAIAQFPLYVDLVWAAIKKVPQRSYTLAG